MPRYFTLVQAEELLPAVEKLIRRGVELKSEYQQAENSIQKATQRIVMLGGSIANRGGMADDRAHRDTAAGALNAVLSELQSMGVQVKDLDTGLLDFPTLFRGQEVLLCWRLGETGISFWHGLEEGFQGRKPLDDDFLANHQGDAVN